jgi:hypothetical protein
MQGGEQMPKYECKDEKWILTEAGWVKTTIYYYHDSICFVEWEPVPEKGDWPEEKTSEVWQVRE